jgi:hypothetical protein
LGISLMNASEYFVIPIKYPNPKELKSLVLNDFEIEGHFIVDGLIA